MIANQLISALLADTELPANNAIRAEMRELIASSRRRLAAGNNETECGAELPPNMEHERRLHEALIEAPERHARREVLMAEPRDD